MNTALIVAAVVAIIILLFKAGIAWENFFKVKCSEPGCNGWEWGHTGHCSDCGKAVGKTKSDIDVFFEQVYQARREAKAEALAQGPEKECPACLSVVPSGARVCRACRHRFWA